MVQRERIAQATAAEDEGMSDFFGDDAPPSRRPAAQRNTRPTIAEEKARLALELSAYCLKSPPVVVNGSVQQVRLWKSRQEAAMKILKSSRHSVTQLEIAIRQMREFK